MILWSLFLTSVSFSDILDFQVSYPTLKIFMEMLLLILP